MHAFRSEAAAVRRVIQDSESCEAAQPHSQGIEAVEASASQQDIALSSTAEEAREDARHAGNDMSSTSSQQSCDKLVNSEQSTSQMEGDAVALTTYDYESEDDASEDDGEELKRMLLTKKRDILVRGIKVLHMATLNLQTDFFVHWRSEISSHAMHTMRGGTGNASCTDAPAAASQQGTGEEEKEEGGEGPAMETDVATGIQVQEPHVVLTESLPERLSALWPDLDLDSYRAGTNMSCKAFRSL